MEFDVTRLRMGPAPMAAWILLGLFLLSNCGSACTQASEITGAQSDFSVVFSLASRFPDQSFRAFPALIGAIDRYPSPRPDPRPLRIWFVHPSFQVPSVSIRPMGRRLSGQDPKFFRSSLVDRSFHRPSLSIQPRDSSFIVRTIDCFDKGLSLGGCGQ